MRTILITAGSVSLKAELNDSKSASAIWEALPMAGHANTWGDEIYFGIPVALDEENGREVMAVGELGYWPPGHAFCIFFGPTPASRGQEIRAASPVNPIGKVTGDATAFRAVAAGERVNLGRA